MYFELMLVCYMICMGFVSAGLLGSFFQLVTAEPAGFHIKDNSVFVGILSVLTICIGGPFIIMRNAIRGRRIEQRHFGWMIGSTIVAVSWSFCSGLFFLDVILSA